MGSRDEMSQYLQLILKCFSKKMIHTHRDTGKCGKMFISELGQKVYKCSLHCSLGSFGKFENSTS